MSFSNIIGGLLSQGMSSQSHDRLRRGAANADRSGGIGDMLGAFLGGGTTGGGAGGTTGGGLGGLADIAREFLSKPQVGGMSGAGIGGLGALAGGLLGGGLGGAAKGGAMAILGTLALQALRGSGASSAVAAAPEPAAAPTEDEVRALTHPETEQLVLRAMIGAAQVDGRISDAELDRILDGMNREDVTEEERVAVHAEITRPVDVAAIGARVSRPEVAAQIYAGALMAVDIDTEAERDYFRRLARALNLGPDVVARLHAMTGAPTT